MNLVVLLHEQEDLAGARDAHQQAIELGQPKRRRAAAVNLGLLLEQEGDVYRAAEAYQPAIG